MAVAARGGGVKGQLRGDARSVDRGRERGCARARRCRTRQRVDMATQRRVERVKRQVEREMSNLLVYDKVLRRAVSPEEGLGADAQVSALASVTRVHMSNDLQVAKVYISIYTDEKGKEVAKERLKRAQGHVRAQIGKRVRLRLTPEVRLLFDDSLERGQRVTSILDRIASERQSRVEPPPSSDHDHGDSELYPP